MKELAKVFEAKQHEDVIYKAWEASGYFNPDNLPRRSTGVSQPFTMSLPPPNATGTLHLGHAVMLAIQDLLARFNRMRGRKVLWLPGTDHAAIATQNVVEKKIWEEEKKTRFDFSREEFVKRVNDFATGSHDTIRQQIRCVGASLDWSRERYTLDEGLSKAVREVFVRMYNDGLIYRGLRIVNWCYRCGTTLADDEVEYKEKTTIFYYLKYGPITIGTARPETKVLDKIIIVHPDDQRFKQYINKEFAVPWIDGFVKAKVVADRVADMDTGTGAMTITPAHSFVDFELAQKYGFDVVAIIGPDGKLTRSAGKFAGLNVKEARKAIVDELQKKGLVEKIDANYKHNLSVCYRCGTPVEPMPSNQWFVAVDKSFKTGLFKKSTLKKLAIQAVASRKIKIIPEKFNKTYFQWINNLHDWCISRQIWFGHQIPVWYCVGDDKGQCKLECKTPLAQTTKPDACPYCGSKVLRQDPDTLDTWFSSSLWTFSTLGWPERTSDLKIHHPTQVMETGYDILFFWVARMIMMTQYATKQIPFQTVYLHGLVRDKQGRKMSKSLGNGIDPLDMIAKYGTDALRLSMIVGTTPGNDFRLYEEKIAGYRNFVNKLWNICRFILLTVEKIPSANSFPIAKTLADRWILSRLNDITQIVTNYIEKFEFSPAAEKLYDFTWHELADWYLEIAKVEKDKDDVLSHILTTILKLWHPFAPFVTEAIWQEIFGQPAMLMIEPWPKTIDTKNEAVEKEMKLIQDIISAVRNFRAENKISKTTVLNCALISDKNQKLLAEQNHLLTNLYTYIKILDQNEYIQLDSSDWEKLVVNDVVINLEK